MNKSDIVFVTGGLGGTSDDITKRVIAEYLNRKIILDENILSEIMEYFKRENKELPTLNKSVAEIIEGSIIHKNPIGYAPSIELNEGGKKIILLPGVHEEAKAIFENIIRNWNGEKRYRKIFRVFGISECEIQDNLTKRIGEKLVNDVYYYPSWKGLCIHINTDSPQRMESITNEFQKEFKKFIFSENDREIEFELQNILTEKGLTISLAESCTGGILSDMITDVPGSSSYFKGGVVAYSNNSKISLLGVKKETLKKFGAVSGETALEMAKSVKKIFDSDIGISITGIAGPGGGMEEKPVGLVFIGIVIKDKETVKKFIFKPPRKRIKLNAATASIFYVVKGLKDETFLWD